MVTTVVLRNPFESLHPVPKHVFQGWSRDGPDAHNFLRATIAFSHDGLPETIDSL
jgi:hypothetical protein